MRQPLCLMAIVTGIVFLNPPSGPPPALTPLLSAVSFMTGCWTGPSPNGATIEEHYTEASSNLMLGMTRYVRAGQVVDFEFTTIERTDSSFVMTPRPKGVKSDSFPLKELTDGRAVWENLAHDFPQRVIYQRGANGELIASIEGKTSKGDRRISWTMHPCETR
jgi:uncharacterized protein DUF6265